jgi:hypothetical protein
MASCCDHRSLFLYKCRGGSSQGFDDDPAYIGNACCCDHTDPLLYKCGSQGFDDPAYMLVVVITDICCISVAAVVKGLMMFLHT